MGDLTSEFFICASSFFVVSSKALRLRSRSIRSVSTALRKRFTSLFAFSYSTAGTFPEATTLDNRSRLSSAAFSGSDEGTGTAARWIAACKSARACFSSRAVVSSAMVASNCPFSTLLPIAPRPAEKGSASRMNPEF